MLRRVVFTLLFGAGIPLAVLSYLALRSISSERRDEVRYSEERAQRAASAVASRFEDELSHVELQVREAVARAAAVEPDEEGEPPGSLNARGRAIAAALEALPAESLIRAGFLVSASGRLVSPRVTRFAPPAREPDPGDRELVRAIRIPDSARESELALVDTELYHVLQQCRDEDLGCVVLVRRAEVAARRNDLDGALELLQAARARPSARGLDGEPVYLEATRRTFELATRAGRQADALAAIVELVQALAEDRWLQDPNERRQLLDEALADARVLVEELRDPPPGLIHALDRALTHATFLEGFEERILPELRRGTLAAAGPHDGPLGPLVRRGLNVLGETRLFAAATLEGAVTVVSSRDATSREAAAVTSRSGHRPEPRAAVFGIELELETIRERLAAEVATVASTTETRLAIVDAIGQFFAGDEPLVRGGAIVEWQGLADALPGWRVVAAPRDPEAPERIASRKLRILGALVATCALVVLGSFAMALRAASREVELAKVRSDLVRNVSHELRTPVASILTLSEVLEDGGLDEAKRQDYVTRISREARRLARLIENVLDLARVERGARRVELRPLPLGEVALAAVEAFRACEEGREATVVLEEPLPGEPVPLDPVALEQVLGNLLSNAVKYSPRGEPVSVRVALEERWARIAVADRGRGLTPPERGRLFAPFFRARPEEGAVHGVGLGLVITRELVRLHGGRLEVASSPGRGSTFTVVLPRGGGSGRVTS